MSLRSSFKCRNVNRRLVNFVRMMAPTLIALSFSGVVNVAHAQGTMDFSGAQTLMGTFKTFAIYAGAVICFGGPIFAGIRMLGGRFQDAAAGATFKVYNPADGNVITEVAAGEASDIDKAVAAAHAQFESGEWSKLTGADRGRLLYRLADLIERDKEIIARMETIDNGKPLGMSLMADLPNLIDTFRYFAGWADKMEGRAIPVPPAFDRQILAYTIREPLDRT